MASITPRILPPGREAKILVEATPVSAGEKTVSIDIKTNSEPNGNLTLWLTMVGNAPPPFVVSDNGPINFGPVRPHSEPLYVRVDTREKLGQSPWLATATCSLPFVAIKGGIVRETALGSALIRRYEFEASIEEIPGPGDFSGEILFSNKLANTPHPPSLVLHGTVRPPVFTSPRLLYVDQQSGSEPIKLSVTLTADDPEFSLTAHSSPCHHSLVVRRVWQTRNQSKFEIAIQDPLQVPLDTTELVFQTNHPKLPVVRVPIILKSNKVGIP